MIIPTIQSQEPCLLIVLTNSHLSLLNLTLNQVTNHWWAPRLTLGAGTWDVARFVIVIVIVTVIITVIVTVIVTVIIIVIVNVNVITFRLTMTAPNWQASPIQCPPSLR